MKQQDWLILFGSAIAVLTSTTPANAALASEGSPNTIDQNIALLGNPPFPGQKGGGASRGGARAIAPGKTTGMNVIWRDRPLFIWEGKVFKFEVREAETKEVLWREEELSSEQRALVYTGEALQPGYTYEWVIYDPQRVSVVTFQVLPTPERDRITADLAELETLSKNNNATNETITLHRAQYFIRQKLWVDALMEAISGKNSALTKNSDSLIYAKNLIKVIQNITFWTFVLELQHNGETQVRPGELQIQVLSGAGNPKNAIQLKEPYLLKYEYNSVEDEWEVPQFRIRIINNSQQSWFIALLDLAQNFSIKSLLGRDTVKLKAGQEFWLNDGDPKEGIIPRELWRQGISSYSNVYKLIACTKDFDPIQLTQAELSNDLKIRESMAESKKGFDGLMERAIEEKNSNITSTSSSGLGKIFRGIVSNLREEKDLPEAWITQQVYLHITRS